MDKHLNIFYSYNRDNELIENNLTRTFIITLMGISKNTRSMLLSFLLSPLGSIFSEYNFTSANFALQNNIKLSPGIIKNIGAKYILTLAEDTFIQNKKDYLSIDKEIIHETLMNRKPPPDFNPILEELCYGSIPDAWIYDEKVENYCILIECKLKGDYLYYPQIVRHANRHYELYDLDEINNRTKQLTWHNILEAIVQLDEYISKQSDLDKYLIKNFVEFLGYYGFRLFRGFDFDNLPLHPTLNISVSESISMFDFESLGEPAIINLFGNLTNSFFDFVNMPVLQQGYFIKNGGFRNE